MESEKQTTMSAKTGKFDSVVKRLATLPVAVTKWSRMRTLI